MTVTREERPMGPYPFRLFLVLSDPAYGQNISSRALNHFEYLLRFLYLIFFSFLYFFIKIFYYEFFSQLSLLCNQSIQTDPFRTWILLQKNQCLNSRTSSKYTPRKQSSTILINLLFIQPLHPLVYSYVEEKLDDLYSFIWICVLC